MFKFALEIGEPILLRFVLISFEGGGRGLIEGFSWWGRERVLVQMSVPRGLSHLSSDCSFFPENAQGCRARARSPGNP